MSKDYVELCIRDVVRKAIIENKLLDLLFTEQGRRLWQGIPLKKMRKIVREELKKI